MISPGHMPGSDRLSPKDDVHAPFVEDLQEEIEQHKLAVTGVHTLSQPFPSLVREIPVQGEWRSGAPPAAKAVVQSGKVPAEVSAGSVDGLTDCTVEAVLVDHVPAVQGEYLACRRIGLPLALVLPGPQGYRQPRVSILGSEFVPHAGAVQSTRADQVPHSLRSGQCVLAPQRHCDVDEAGSKGGRFGIDDGDLADEVGPHRGTVAVEKGEPCVPRHGATTTDMIEALQQVTLRETTFELHPAYALLIQQRGEESLGLVSKAPEVAVVLVRGQRVLLPLAGPP